MGSEWVPFPHGGEFDHLDAAEVRRRWDRLHAGDAEPLPADPSVLQAWVLYHRGEFREAVDAGLAAGGHGVTVANRATCIYANYLEPDEQARLALFQEVADRAQAQTRREPANPAAWYLHGYALGRYAQAVSVAKALAQGLGGRVKDSFERAIQLQPRHADAHIALGAFHAEVIDKVGTLIGGMTYGAKKDTGLRLFEEGLRLCPQSPIGLVEYATGLVMLEGPGAMERATQLYERAAAIEPVDAAQRLDVDLAVAELQD